MNQKNVQHEKKMTSANQRIHALDNLRAILALLGIPFHAAFIIALLAIGSAQPVIHYGNQLPMEMFSYAKHVIFIPIFYLHLFWMPAFFLLAGFFAQLIHEKRGKNELLRNRFLRVGLPLAIIIGIYLLFYTLGTFFSSMTTHQSFTTLLFENSKNGHLFNYINNLMVYWFIYFLLLFYVITWTFLTVYKHLHLSRAIQKRIANTTHFLFRTRWVYLILFILNSALLIIGHDWFAIIDTHMTLSISLFLYYFTWYVMGWMLYKQQFHLDQLKPRAVQKMMVSFLCYLAFLFCYKHFFHSNNTPGYFLTVFLYVFSVVLGTTGCIGILWRFFGKEYKTTRYLGRASYWLYLTQFQILLILVTISTLFTRSFIIQFLFATIVCTALCLLSYHFIVKKTWLRKVVG